MLKIYEYYLKVFFKLGIHSTLHILLTNTKIILNSLHLKFEPWMSFHHFLIQFAIKSSNKYLNNRVTLTIQQWEDKCPFTVTNNTSHLLCSCTKVQHNCWPTCFILEKYPTVANHKNSFWLLGSDAHAGSRKWEDFCGSERWYKNRKGGLSGIIFSAQQISHKRQKHPEQ